tara:strand:+ start:833 stop:958 length:126 start_codon:yes stop_codon:yes gene_type:complete
MQKIRKFILEPTAKAKANIANSNIFLDKKKVPIEKKRNAHE